MCSSLLIYASGYTNVSADIPYMQQLRPLLSVCAQSITFCKHLANGNTLLPAMLVALDAGLSQ